MPFGTLSDSEPLVPLRAALPAANTAGLRWLAGLADDPTACLSAWVDGGLAPVPLGQVAVLRVARVLALPLLEQWTGATAPVLCPETDRAAWYFLVPRPPAGVLQLPAEPGGVGAVDLGLVLPPGEFPAVRSGSSEWCSLDRLAGLVDMGITGVLMCPAPGRAVESRRGTRWQVPPDGSGRLWDAAAVVEAAAAHLQHWMVKVAADELRISRQLQQSVLPARSHGSVAARFAEASRALRRGAELPALTP